MPDTEKRDNTRVQILPTDNPMEYLQKQWELAARKSREERQREEAAKNIESNMKAAQQRFNDQDLWKRITKALDQMKQNIKPLKHGGKIENPDH